MTEEIAIVTDTHFDIRANDRIFDDYLKVIWSDFWKYVKEMGIKRVVHLGDVFDRRKTIDIKAVQRAKDYFFDPVRLYGLEAIVIVGNHDTYFKNTSDYNSPSIFFSNYSPGLRILTSPDSIVVNGEKSILVPWINEGNYHKTMKFLEKEIDADTLMGHFEFSGFELIKGMKTSGMDHTKPPFSSFRKIYSGHFHEKMRQGNVEYIGAMGQYTWHDLNCARGFNTFDGTKMTFHKNAIDLLGVIDLRKERKKLVQPIDEMRRKHVKVIVSDDVKNELLNEVIAELQTNRCSVRVVEDKKPVNFVSDISTTEDHLSVDNVSLILEYIDQMDLEGIKSETKREAESIHREAIVKQ